MKKLTPEQEQIVRDKQVTLSRKPDELFELLAGLADFDAGANKTAKYLGIVSVGLGVASVLLYMAPSILAEYHPRIILTVLVLGAIAAGIMRIRLLRFDVSDDLGRFLIPVMSLLREDADPEQPIKMRLDLSLPTDQSHRKSQGPMPGRASVDESHYHHPWIDCEMALADGNRLRWSVVDNIRQRVRRKRKSTVTRYKRKSVIDVEIKSREKKYGVIAEQAFSPSDYQTREKGSSIALRNVVITTSLDPLDPKELTSVIGAAYSRLQPLKKEGQS